MGWERLLCCRPTWGPFPTKILSLTAESLRSIIQLNG